MAKGKGKKRKEADFKKVKFKPGRKLKKPNETDASFKTQRVVLLDHTKSAAGADTPTTYRKLNMTELLQHLHHYNLNVRKDGLIGLKELLTANPGLIVGHLGLLIGSLFPLLYDDAKAVREAVLPLVRLLCAQVSDERIVQPHFDLICAHLGCAMTHLQESVRQTALQCVEQLQRCYPHLSAANASLIECFTNLLPHSSSWSNLMSRKQKEQLLHSYLGFIGAACSLESKQNRCSVDESTGSRSITWSGDHRNEISILPNRNAFCTQNVVGDGFPLNKPSVLLFVLRRTFAFLDSFWLEITTSDASFSGCSAAADEDGVGVELVGLACSDVDLVAIFNICTLYNRLFQFTFAVLEREVHECDEIRRFLRVEFATKRLLARYRSVFPCVRKAAPAADSTAVAKLRRKQLLQSLSNEISSSSSCANVRSLCDMANLALKEFLITLSRVRGDNSMRVDRQQ